MRLLNTGFYLLILVVFGAFKPASDSVLDYVDPMIGTDGIGHTFPGATTPFGMVQLSPSNDFKSWNWCSGYHYSDEVLKGFAHTHISGAGLAALGDILMMPMTGEATTNPGTEENPESGYRSRFTHDKESAAAGYYQVELLDYDINVELTTSPRVGFHRYTFQNAGTAHVVIDPTHHIMETIFDTEIEQLSSTTIRGLKESEGEGGRRKVYFYAEFSRPLSALKLSRDGQWISDTKANGEDIRAVASFNDLEAGAQLSVKVAISNVSYEGAEANFMAEAQDLQFDQALAATQALWKKQLGSIEVDVVEEEDKTVFFTALYHAFISPNIISDVTGEYIVEGKKYKTDIPQYSNYSTWDTYRALHPLFTIIEQERSAEMVNSLSSRTSVSNVVLPKWECLGFDNVCMIGYNSVSPMADAILKNIPGINIEEAYEAMKMAAMDEGKHSPNYDVNGMPDYKKINFVPGEIGCSVSKTVENNYFDWCLAQVAKQLGKAEDARLFGERALGYRHLYDENTGYLLPKKSDGISQPQNLTIWDDIIKNYVSGNIWGYSTYAPHDVSALMAMHGGPDKFEQFLDMIFQDTTEIVGEQHVDISGFIGKYGHGDEPSHHMPYLYTYAGKPWKTQEMVHQVMEEFYTAQPDGLINNEDLGQMSAWYIFSAMGFYPVCPGDLQYVFGSPKLKSAELKLENGKTFRMKANNIAKNNIYIKSLSLNGKPYTKTFIRHEDIMNGGELVYEMTDKPTLFGTQEADLPMKWVNAEDLVEQEMKVTYMPFSQQEKQFFAKSLLVDLNVNSDKAEIRYTLDGTEPTENAALYKKPIKLTCSATLKARAFETGKLASKVFERDYIQSKSAGLAAGYPKITLLGAKVDSYGDEQGLNLINGKRGTPVFADGLWTGFTKDDFVALIDLGEELSLTEVSLGTLTNTGVWIFPPKSVKIYIGNGENMALVATKTLNPLPAHEVKRLQHDLKFSKQKARYVKVVVENYGPLPTWHGGTGKYPFVFLDEIYVN
ncbi:GH92 family glycosyl hydrolase [Persicobacter diffluens]